MHEFFIKDQRLNFVGFTVFSQVYGWPLALESGLNVWLDGKSPSTKACIQ
jgi:hypothetical protein